MSAVRLDLRKAPWGQRHPIDTGSTALVKDALPPGGRGVGRGGGGGGVVVCWFLNVPATCKCISETDLLRQFYMLPH